MQTINLSIKVALAAADRYERNVREAKSKSTSQVEG